MEERATAMATANPPRSIAELYHSCIGSFENIITEIVNKLATPELDPGSDTYGTQALQLLRDQIGRFRIWAGNMGAHHQAGNRMSLDYKLKEASHIHKTVLGLLGELNSLLRKTLEVLCSTSENHPGSDPTPAAIQEAEETETDLDDEEKDDNVSDSGSSTSGSGSPLSDLVFILDETSNIISCLYTLSVAIRQPVPQDRLRKYADIDLSHYEFFDNQHVLEKFPTAEPFLSKRLGNANTQRRQYFKYRLLHHEKISQGLKDVIAISPPQSIDLGVESLDLEHRCADTEQGNHRSSRNATNQDVAATVITAARTSTTISIVPKSAVIFMQPALDTIEAESDGGQTTTSFGTIMETGHVKLLKVPNPPDADHAFAQNAFQCPYCYTLIIVKNRKAWKRHVFRDLRPYVCTFNSCTKPNRLFETRHDWYNHEERHHRREWYCAECTIAFPTSSIFTDHLRGTHPASLLVEGQEVSMLVSNCERRLSTPQQCPLCPGQSKHIAHHLRSHLGQHMQQLALFTLPRLQMDENEGEDLPSEAGLKGRGGESSDDENEEEEMSELEFNSNPGEERAGEEEHPGENEKAVAGEEGAEANNEAKSKLEKLGIDESRKNDLVDRIRRRSFSSSFFDDLRDRRSDSDVFSLSVLLSVDLLSSLRDLINELLQLNDDDLLAVRDAVRAKSDSKS